MTVVPVTSPAERVHDAVTGCLEQVDSGGQRSFDTGEYADEAMRALAAGGLFGILIPERYGGLGATTAEYVQALDRIGAADSGIALSWEVHVLATEIYRRYGDDAQRDYWLPRLASGTSLAGVAITEPGAGSDLRSIATRARRDDGCWVLDGEKVFITNTGTPHSDGLLVLARTDEDDGTKPTFGVFVVPRDTPGYLPGDRIRTIGWRGMDTREVRFTDCRLPASSLIGSPTNGMEITARALGLGRIAFASIAVGVTQRCLDQALSFARARRQFGRSISSFQAIQFMLADIATELAAARTLTAEAARLRDEDADWMTMSSMVKLFASQCCVRAANQAIQIHGARGFSVNNDIARFYIDAKMMEIGEGTTQMQQMIIARSLGC